MWVRKHQNFSVAQVKSIINLCVSTSITLNDFPLQSHNKEELKINITCREKSGLQATLVY